MLVFLLVKRESFGAMVTHNFISMTEINLWNIDPVSAADRFEKSKKSSFASNLFKEFDKVAFSDGSWLSSKGKGGMGGLVFF